MRWIVLLSLLAGTAHADPSKDFDAYMKAHNFDCVGPFETVQNPEAVWVDGKKYMLDGYKLTVDDAAKDKDGVARIGILGAIKDSSPETFAALDKFYAWFKEKKVDAVVSNGDLALDEADLEGVMKKLADSGMLTYILIGNSESRGSFARVYRDLWKEHKNLVNLNWVRHVVADDYELLSLPGYHDKRFVHTGAGCKYEPDHISVMRATATGAGPAKVLVAHGPPKGEGKGALDYAQDAGNVGDPDMTQLLEDAKINFGIFGHILEAGGAVVGAGGKPVKAGKPSPTLYLNAGTANPLPWRMNDGSSGKGMAFILTIEGDKASYELKKLQ